MGVRYEWSSRQEVNLNRTVQMSERCQSVPSKVVVCSLGGECVMSREMKINVKVAYDQTLMPPLFQKKRQNSEEPPSCCVCKLLTQPGKVKSFQQTCQNCVLWELTEPTG